MLVLRIIQELWQTSGGVFNVDEVPHVTHVTHVTHVMLRNVAPANLTLRNVVSHCSRHDFI
jgi:hypothetical protein